MSTPRPFGKSHRPPTGSVTDRGCPRQRCLSNPLRIPQGDDTEGQRRPLVAVTLRRSCMSVPRRSRMLPKRMSLLLATSLLSVTAMPTATAATARVTDPRGDAAPGADIVRVTYTNAHTHVGFRLQVRDLRPRSEFLLVAGQPRSDWAFVAKVKPGRLRWGFQTVTRTRWIGCRSATLKWMPRRDVVQVRVPRSCLNRAGFRGSLYMQALSDVRNGDHAPSRVVRRG